MILTALKQYYDRLAGEDKPKVPIYGFSEEKIDFELVIDKNGKLVGIEALSETQGKKKIRRSLTVPKIFPGTKGNGIKANFLWEETGYIFGKGTSEKDDPRAKEKFKVFKKLHYDIGKDTDDDGMEAVLKFLENRNPPIVNDVVDWKEIVGKKMVFRLDGEHKWIFERDIVRHAIIEYVEKQLDADSEGFETRLERCLITGETSPIEILHPGIKNIRSADQAELKIVGFQKQRTAFCSYGRDSQQGYNSPCSKKSAFAYGAALNYLTKNRAIQIGDATTVFWAEKPTPIENLLSQILNPQEEDTSTISDVRLFLQEVRQGEMPKDFEPQTKFYILGLSPNAARLSVRFWYAGTVGELSARIGRHFRDIEIENSRETDKDFPGMWQLLVQTTVKGKTDNINPLLSGELMRSILMGVNYPESMLSALIGRIRAGEPINYLRAAMIKGILRRNHKMEVSMSWDNNRKDTAYLLGGLFAILEKTQSDAGNETIREKYFRSASATPKIAFSVLMPLAQHHITKAEYGFQNDKRIAEIMGNIEEFPSFLSLQDQGLFSIGYYHMRNKIWNEIKEASNAKKAKSDKQ